MAQSNGPSVRQRRVARMLRNWRKARGKNLDEVAGALRWSESKLSRYERAKVNAGPAEIIALAAILGVDDATRDKAVHLAVAASEGISPWGTYSPDALRGSFRDYLEDEFEATQVRTVEMVLITGLLQTEAYAEELVRVWEPDLTDEIVAERRQLRRDRQARLDASRGPLRLHSILFEPSLKLPIGGADVMREQLEHLLKRARLPNVTLQVLPEAVGAFPGIGTSYHLVTFEEDEPGAVYLEHLMDGVHIEEEDDLKAYTLNFGRLSSMALSPDKSARRIQEIIRAWR
ncbi:transcriptional regulator [Longimycelium tulufanense]|uniref:Transcriptional regulator n=1 Tax=Longimycelium tulufanense TaxID=907463 RepID=A0A8J3CAU7_9PSEU|nr:helix-turn-helix transcriptional regulator [Longimycelium tulufanense]GGM39238.1 transcriptional regulator [Longimycelium tulufanense]